MLDAAGDAAPMLIGAQVAEGCPYWWGARGADRVACCAIFARPLFRHGDPADFACFNCDRPIILYSDRRRGAQARKSPDFHPVTMPGIVFNRTRDRGYAEWSAGWAGGTFRPRFTDNRWRIDSIDAWLG